MTKPTTITRWLQEPSSLELDDIIEAEELLKTHPYFVPARYVSAIVPHSKQAFDAAMMTQMQLYKGHWLYLNEFLTHARIEGKGSAAVNTAAARHNDDNSFGDLNEFNGQIDDDDFNNFDDDEESGIDEFIARQEEKLAGSTPVEATHEPITEPIVEQMEEPSVAPPAEEPAVIQIQTDENVIAPLEEMPVPQDITPGPIEESIIISVMEEAPAPEMPAMEEHLIIDPAAPSISKTTPPARPAKEPSLIQPIYTEDYFLHLGIQVPEKHKDISPKEEPEQDKDKSLMVVMSFSEWLIHFKTKGEREKEEVEDQKALKTMWQKEKLAAALEEENEEIPENVFEMAVNSIAKEDDLASESLAEIMVKQGKYDKAIEMYRKLSLRNPQKSVYFARKIEDINKEKLL